MKLENLSNSKITFLLTGFSKLNAIELIGMARLLCVDIMKKEKDKMRPFEDILADMIVNYATAARKSRRTIDKVLKAMINK